VDYSEVISLTYQ